MYPLPQFRIAKCKMGNHGLRRELRECPENPFTVRNILATKGYSENLVDHMMKKQIGIVVKGQRGELSRISELYKGDTRTMLSI